MPYEIVKRGARHCVQKVGGGIVPGGCHSSHGQALAHQRALMANVQHVEDPDDAVQLYEDRDVAIKREVYTQPIKARE
jgi:hypothetical protein